MSEISAKEINCGSMLLTDNVAQQTHNVGYPRCQATEDSDVTVGLLK